MPPVRSLQHRNQPVIRVVSWSCVLFLAFLSLLPSDLELRTGAPDELEHFLAYFVAAVLFGISYPRRLFLVAITLAMIAILLEALQIFSPGRSVRVLDAGFSGAGAISGVITVVLVTRWKVHRLPTKL